MKRLKIMKAYAVLWLFIYFLIQSNIEQLTTFFFATLTFNLAVLTVLVIGIIVIMNSSINLVMLAGTFGILAYKKKNLDFYLQGIDKIMPANIAHMFHSRAQKGVLIFTAEESRTVIEWIDEKFSNQNRYINFFIGTALMIGLLGTFTGLLVAIDEMGKIILSLSGDIDLGKVIRDFAGPLGGMATGFGSSLFGVVTAIILGIMGYILNKNQESLIEGVEDWLKGRIIDSAGATRATNNSEIANATEQLPEHQSSFIDVFIENIASLTKEMANIAQTNDRLHSITVASIQQARDEHEMSYELFESINKSLIGIDSTSKTTAEVIDEKLSTLDTKMQSQLEILENQEDKESIKVLQTELQNIRELLGNTDEMQLLQSIEKLNKIQIYDSRKLKQEQELVQSDSKQLLEKQREILELLVGKNEESLDELKKISGNSGIFKNRDEKSSNTTQKPNGFFSKYFK